MIGLTADAALTPKSDGFDFRGRVLGPEGKPVEGAKLYVIYPTPARLPPPEVRAVTDAGGNFRFAMAKSEFDKSQDSDPWATACIVGVAPRHGVDEASAICFEVSGTLKEAVRSIPTYDLEALGKRVRETSATLRLVRDDVPLEGRIVDPGGRPVVGATVRVLEFTAPENEDLTPWLEAVQRGEDYDVTREVLDGGGKMIVPAASQQFQHILPAATTDAEGRFRMEGIGRERIVRLLIAGPQIASEKIYSRTRLGPTFQVPHLLERAMSGALTYYGASFEHVARPSVPIAGTVQDKDTGKPLAGVAVEVNRLPKVTFQGSSSALDMDFASEHVRAVTDSNGRYQLTGAPDQEGNSILAVPPPDQPYLLSMKSVGPSGGKDSVQVDLALKRGVWIRGQVTEGGTGKPVRAVVTYFAFGDNPHTSSMRGLGWTGYPGYANPYRTAEDGRYAIPGLLGRGIVGIFALDWIRYRRGAGAREIPGAESLGEYFVFRTLPSTCMSENFNSVAEVNPAEGVLEAFQRDIVLDSGQHLTGTVLDPDGKPLSGASYCGHIQFPIFRPSSSPTFEVEGYYPEQPRTLVFMHKERKLAGGLVLKGTQKGELSVRLKPWGAVAGRVVDAEGKPQANLAIAGYAESPFPPAGYGVLPERHYVTDRQGRFQIEGLAPAMKYNILAHDRRQVSGIGQLAFELVLQPGETKDLGDLQIKEWEREGARVFKRSFKRDPPPPPRK